MKDNNRHGHRHGKGSRAFENHSRGRGDDQVRRGRPWRFQLAGEYFDPYEPHHRATARIAALPGKHVRSVREQVRATHGKAL